MVFGICLKGVNALYFKSYLDFFCEFVPMIIFAVGFFGYMVLLIFIKVRKKMKKIYVCLNYIYNNHSYLLQYGTIIFFYIDQQFIIVCIHCSSDDYRLNNHRPNYYLFIYSFSCAVEY